MNTKCKTDLIVIPYRDQYFVKEYGLAVRDLQFIKTISDIGCFKTIRVINRPVSLYERVLGKINHALPLIPGVEFIDSTSFDLLGPLKGRAWATTCFASRIDQITAEYIESDSNLVILDFSPFARFSVVKTHNIFYWYDLIDNFTKHNRYTPTQKKLVQEKYNWANKNYNFVTGVTSEAMASFSLNQQVLSNGVFFDTTNIHTTQKKSEKFDFGFIGFITDKLDLEFIKRISKNYSVAIYGTCLDKKIHRRIKEMPNVHYFGKFKYAEIEKITKTFKIGMLPYLKEKSHDESPLKLYEYFKHNLPCVSSIDYEIQSEFIVNYNQSDLNDEIVRSLAAISGDCSISASIQECWHIKYNLSAAINKVLTYFDSSNQQRNLITYSIDIH